MIKFTHCAGFFGRLCLSLFLLGAPLMGGAQWMDRYYRVRVDLSGPKTMADLAALGVEADHGHLHPGVDFVTDWSGEELNLARAAGFVCEVLISDVQDWYKKRDREPEAAERSAACKPGYPFPAPVNYTNGSMGGYHTLQEMLGMLDQMKAKYPHLISARRPLSDTTLTHEGRPVWWVRISNNPEMEQSKPEVLYTALHHAREPNSLSQMLYFMWYVLENYDSNVRIRSIVDNMELYFVPCLNPDGYVYNELTDPDGGGMWRKNRRDNGDGSYGVDLNRNYGHFWGLNNQGSSPNTNAQIYRGPAPFSEPETQMIRDFVLEHNFRVVQNYHTFGNLLIHPWGYSNLPADSVFIRLREFFTKENNYLAGTTSQTVGYAVNGVSDDWMYAAAGCHAFTPEVGPWFWPMPSEIESLNRDCIWMNLATALSALIYAETDDLGYGVIDTGTITMPFRIRRIGEALGGFQLALEPLHPDVPAPMPLTLNPGLNQTQKFQFNVQIPGSIAVGTQLAFVLRMTSANYAFRDTIYRTVGRPPVIAFESSGGENPPKWSGNWGLSSQFFVSPPFSFADSPSGSYPPNAFSTFESAAIGIPTKAIAAELRFQARWQIQPEYDFVMFSALETNNLYGRALCGRYSRNGSVYQIPGEPVYDGFQSAWVQESMDISDFIGKTFRIETFLSSDAAIEYDGFYFDDMQVAYFDSATSAWVELPLVQLSQSWPNPVNTGAWVAWTLPDGIALDGALLEVFDVYGHLVCVVALDPRRQDNAWLDTHDWTPGTYLYRLRGEGWLSETRKLAVQK